MRTHKLAGFTQIDRTHDPDYFIRFLDTASAEASFQAYKRRTYELLDVRPGQQVLEVACGTGDDARVLAGQVGSGRVLAVDASQAMIAEALRRSAGSRLPLDFQVADAQHLPFSADSFHACRCDRSFMHIPDPRRALAEMVRVARPGAAIVVFEVDFGTLTIDAPDRALARKVLHVWTEGFRNGWLGRYVPGLFLEQRLAEVRVEPAVLRLNAPLVNEVVGGGIVARGRENGQLTADEADAWLTYLQDALTSGRFFSTLTGFIVAGRKVA
jgi:ubiquinone/menaquinone biosynthesis C-methylase UbiE